jgi:hypothetical protein
VKDRFEQAAAFGLSGSELRFQPVAQGHQLVHLGDDAVLLSEWWERHYCMVDLLRAQIGYGGSKRDAQISRHDRLKKNLMKSILIKKTSILPTL